MVQTLFAPIAASTSSRVATRSRLGDRVVKVPGACGLTLPVSSGRPSFCHFWKPPFSTAALSWPNTRSIHHRRVAHQWKPVE
jgi:hypothetical protein